MHLGATAQRRLATFVPPLLVALLTLPFIIHQNAWWEWANPYWFLGRQTAHVSATGLPTLFLQLETGAFNPYYVYYAGPTLSVLAYPAVLIGAWPVFAAATVAATVAGYLGIWWAARTLGLSRRLAILPGLAFATTPFLVSTLYDRGAWAELVAANAAAVLLAGLLAVTFRRPGARDTGALIAILSAAAVIAGTHNITLMVSAVVLPLLLSALLPLRPPDAPPLGRALARAAVAGAAGIALTAAWLLPNLWYGRDTLIAQPRINDDTLSNFPGGASASALLTPWPHVPGPIVDGGRMIHPQLPVLVLLWTVGAFAVLLARRRVPVRVLGSTLALVALGAALVVLVAHQPWWLHFPSLMRAIQFPFRLLTYVSLIIALGSVLAMRALGIGRGGRLAITALGVAVIVQIGFAAYVALDSQATTAFLGVKPPREADARAAAVPAAFSLPNLLTPLQFRVIDRPTSTDAVSADASIAIDDPLTSDRATLGGAQPVGSEVVVPVAWSPYVRVTGGASLVGRDAQGAMVVRIDATGPDGHWAAVVSPATPWPLALGRWLSLFSVAALLAAGVAALARRRRRRSAPLQNALPPDPVPALVE
jgi:hypothetical protein